MKRLLALTLSALLTSAAWAQDEPPPLTDSARALASEYGIGLEQLYPGSLVALALDELLRASEAEARDMASKAYAEGLKAGLLEAEPGRAAAEARARALETALKAAVAERDAARGEVEALKRWLYAGSAVGALAIILALLF